MTEIEKLLVCVIASIAVHAALGAILEQLPELPPVVAARKITVTVEDKKPPPPPEPPPEPPKPPEPKSLPPPVKQPVHEAPRPHPPKAVVQPAPPKDTPPPEHAPVTPDTTDDAAFGASIESTSQAGTGPAVPVGNTTAPAAHEGSAAPVKPLAQPIAAVEATKMPLPRGNCAGKYTDDALKAGVEGTVVLDLIVGEDGRVREVQVAQGLPHGLTAAAVAAARACRFSPGEKDGKPVPVRVRGFKVTFVLPEQGG